MTNYNVYSNELIEPSCAENNGSISLSLFDFSLQNNGVDDHNSAVIGTLETSIDWILCLSESGLPLFQNNNTTVLLEGEFAEDFLTIGTKYDGLRYSQSISDGSIDLSESDEWQEIESECCSRF